MPGYVLTVTRIDQDPDYEKKLADYESARERQRGYGGFQGETMPSRYLETRTSHVELTEAEYHVVRQALIQFWEKS